MNISYTRAATFRQCPMKYKYRYIDNLVPLFRDTPLILGTAIHKAFEDYHNGASTGECLVNINNTFAEAIDKAELADKESLQIAAATARGMWKHNPWHRDSFSKYIPEKEFNLNLGYGNTINGRVDGLFSLKDSDTLWVRELKTASSDNTNKMTVSHQASTYIYAFQKHKVFGVMYDVMIKPRIRKRNTEDAKQFCQRIEDEYSWNRDQYYKRVFVYRSPFDLKEFKADIRRQIAIMKRMEREGSFYRCTESCYSLFNSECPYRKICFEEFRDDAMVSLFYKKDGSNEPLDTKGGQ